MSLAAAWDSLPCSEFMDLVDNLPRDAAYVRAITHGWGPHEENTARLLEARTFELGLDWADRTIDQDDPEVKRERRAAKKAGIKPPPEPLIPPTAFRPPVLAERRVQEYLEQIAQYQLESAPEKRILTSAEYDAEMGLEAEFA